MKRFIYLSIMLVFVGLLSAAEIVVKEELRVNTNDLTLIRTPKKDFSGRDCALIKISTDLAPFDKIDSNQTPVEINNRSGEVWLYLSPGERRLVFSKDGYARLNYDLPITIESNKVYEMKLIGSGVNVSRAFPVTIRVNPADAILKVDNVEYPAAKPVLLEPGTYSVEVSKSGYITEQRQITVNAEKVFFEVSLMAQDPVLTTIRSTPTEADIMIDNVNDGRTNRQIYRFPGSYNLRISKNGYDTIEEKITVKETGENTFTYTLQKSTVTLSLSLDPPDATVLINNAEVIGTSHELAPGQYKIEVKKSGYDTVEKRIELQKSRDINEIITLKQSENKAATGTVDAQTERIFVQYDDPPVMVGSLIPVYPDFAKRAGVQGIVVLEVEVYRDGSIGDIRVKRSVQSGPKGLDEAAKQAVRKVQFKPGRSSGQAVDTVVIIPIEFRLN